MYKILWMMHWNSSCVLLVFYSSNYNYGPHLKESKESRYCYNWITVSCPWFRRFWYTEILTSFLKSNFWNHAFSYENYFNTYFEKIFFSFFSILGSTLKFFLSRKFSIIKVVYFKLSFEYKRKLLLIISGTCKT